MRHYLLIVFLLFSCLTGYTQGSATGTIKDKETGELLTGATVVVKGTTNGTISDFDGNYTLDNIPVGEQILECSFISYEKQSIKIDIKDGEEIAINFDLGNAQVSLDEVQVVAKANRENENMLLMEQKDAAIMSESIGAKELSNKGVSDASSAATKITGITKQEGSKTLNVRGLGDRYNTTTLNGLPLPSNNSENKNIDLGLFSTDIISHINIEKSFSPNLYGDFGGANINIVTKKFIGKEYLKLNIEGGTNSGVFNTEKLMLQKGPHWDGFYNTAEPNINSLKDYEEYKFENSWNPEYRKTLPNATLGLSGGKSFDSFLKGNLNTFFNVSFDNEYGYSEISRLNINGSDYKYIDLSGDRYTYETQSTGILNLNYSRTNNEIYFNTIFLNSSEQFLEQTTGEIKEETGDLQLFRRTEFERNIVMINQLLGEHKLSNNYNFNWGIAYNSMENIIPDRLQNVFQEYYPESGTGIFSEEPTGTNYRYFHSYIDDEMAANMSLNKAFGEGIGQAQSRGNISIGFSGRYKSREFQNNQYIHDIYSAREVAEYVTEDIDNIDNFFNTENLVNREFKVKEVISGGFWYKGNFYNNAAFTTLEYNITEKFLAIIGARAEYVYQEIEYHSNQGDGKEEFEGLKFLPSISLKYGYNEKTNLRFSSSKTYTLPQLSEMPDIIIEGISEEVRGNPFLYPSTVYNGEIKWERFPNVGELISLAAFGKYIENPINKFVTGSSSKQYSIANTGEWALIYGVELDIKKDLYKASTNHGYKKLFLATNLTLMQNEQDLNQEKVKNETDGNSKPISVNFSTNRDIIQGAANVIANASLGYKLDWDNGDKSFTSSVVYNYVSDRLYSLGYLSVGNRMDEAVNTLDLVIKSTIKNFEIGISAKNLLDQEIQRVQYNQSNDWVIKSYKKGTSYKLGITYKF